MDAAPVYGQTAYYSGRTIEGIRYTREVAERDGWYDYGSQAQADVDVLLARIEELEARLAKIPEGDPAVVRPSDSRAESQAGSNGPSGSPISPSGPDLFAAATEALEALRDTIACIVNTVPMGEWTQDAYGEWSAARERLEKALGVDPE